MEETLKLVREAQLNFTSQNLEIVHLAFDKMRLGAMTYLQPYEVSLASSGSATNNAEVPEGQVWVIYRIEHRDIEPGIFDVFFSIDGMEIFPTTRLESVHFPLLLAKPMICMKRLTTKVINQDTTTKTYRHIKIWHRYDKIALNKFLYGIFGEVAPILK